ncbi:FAD-binding domain-containing protein [Thiocapsa rosea]|uniref:Deoxyribodipyrimidine photo-lyase family protein (Cryptochrome) n=1 Tax=Thiocapsa rosea TaxID=69360 RepID=A0A495V713_9GAMM|nr:deoxyribodipyrimidine photo-lyase [Thiocapsa rosea]RKT44147.1 deoxyribodipyrimidine photo-lyase family protein (cryptochrome) [Thiocapsa rosea]
MQLVWFKRDLRVYDHAALAEAAGHGPVLPLYIAEPGYWSQPDSSGRHWAFIAECLVELQADLAALGQPLVIRVGEAIPVLNALLDRLPIQAVWSHEETGNGWTYARDIAVGDLLRSRGIPWHERPQNGVVRRLETRNRWSQIWEHRMRMPLEPPPTLRPLGTLSEIGGLGATPDTRDLGIADDPCPQRQPGGRRAGVVTLESFLRERGEAYHREMSSPLTAYESCSRLSTHLAWGTLSIRELVQATRHYREQVAALVQTSGQRSTWSKALSAFEGRLHWHCHFMQKLESEPRIEFENMHRACDGLRDPTPDRERLDAWRQGLTGFPFVDACMRALTHNGWINFRMRAMLVSFSSYHLWLHWREPGLHLARVFTDYEPGIHWSQVQMQSGTTGINTLRIYNPVKQSQDQDPEGVFIRRWIPELADVADARIHTPWKMSGPEQDACGCGIGRDYPYPILDHEAAAREARRRMGAIRRRAESRAASRTIFETHGSRRRSGGSSRTRTTTTKIGSKKRQPPSPEPTS